MRHHTARFGRLRRAQRGLSIVELLIGITISLFILAGATVIVSSQLADNRRMLLEVQMQQDMRAVLDMVGRDLRRAAYWAQSDSSVWPSANAALDNPYKAISSSSSSLQYSRSQDEAGGQAWGTDNNAVDSDEEVGFQYNVAAKRVEMLVGTDNWQSLTDENVLQVDQFSVTFNDRSVPAPCGADCPTGPSGCPLVLKVRDATIVMVAHATRDASVTRSVQSNVRLRNDVLAEAC